MKTPIIDTQWQMPEYKTDKYADNCIESKFIVMSIKMISLKPGRFLVPTNREASLV